MAHWDAMTEEALGKRLDLHPRAMHDCAVRNPVPKVHVYPEQVFLVLHAPERGARGHVHYIELDQYIGPNWLLTVHGPMNPVVPLEAAYVETGAIARRLEDGRLHPTRSCELSAALVTALTNRLRDFLTDADPGGVEAGAAGHRRPHGRPRGVPGGAVRGPARAARGAHDGRAEPRGVRADVPAVGVRAGRRGQLDDLEDQFQRIAAMADSQREYLQGVIEFYQTRTGTKMTIAAERLAVIAAVTLPITALSSIMGMNVIVNDSTHWGAALAAAGDHERDVVDAADLGPPQGLVVAAGRSPS